MEWFRWYHDTVSDSKFKMIGKKLSLHVSQIIVTWMAFLEYASNAKKRGSLKGINIAKIAYDVELSEDEILLIRDAFISMKMIDRYGSVTRWRKRQPESDADPTKAERQKRYRERINAASRNASRETIDQIRSETEQIDSVNKFTSSSAHAREDDEVKNLDDHEGVGIALQKLIEHRNEELIPKQKSLISIEFPKWFREARCQHPEISKQKLLTAFQATLNDAVKFSGRTCNWYKSTFFDHLERMGYVVRGP